MCCRSCSTQIGFRRGLLLGHSDGASIAAIYAGSRQDHRVEGIALIAPAFHRRGYFGRVDRRDQDGLRDHEPERETLALAQGRRQRLLRLERRLARSAIPRLGYFRVSRLYPGAGRDRAGCGGSVRHHASGRDRAGGMLLPGRCRGHRQCRPLPASRGDGRDAGGDCRFRGGGAACRRGTGGLRGRRRRLAHWPTGRFSEHETKCMFLRSQTGRSTKHALLCM